MFGKVALEEHFALPETLGALDGFAPADAVAFMRERLLDLGDGRLRAVEEGGIETMVLSLNSPAVQAVPDPRLARELAERVNDRLAEAVARNPGRFQGFAALPMQDPDAAARELERAITELGFVGALVNGYSTIDQEAAVYLDDPRYSAFWATAERLGRPFYLHPRNPPPTSQQPYKGHDWLLGPTWAYGQETAVHALRLMGSGLFDRHPGLKLVLGHLGEGLASLIWRVDNRNGWIDAPPDHAAKLPIGAYAERNLFVTTSGHFSTPALLGVILQLGMERVLFSVDWPFEMPASAAAWFDALPLSARDKTRIARVNAIELLGLSLPSAGTCMALDEPKARSSHASAVLA